MKEIPPLWEYLLFSIQIYYIFSRNPNAPKRVRNLTFFDFFILGKRKHRMTQNLHTELKVAVRTCEGKAMHRMTQNFVFDRRT